MQKEKKLKGNQKLALERIYRLFELAKENDKYAKRYLQLAKRIGEKCRVSIPHELKIQYCKKCYSTNVKKTTQGKLLIAECLDCKTQRKHRLAKE